MGGFPPPPPPAGAPTWPPPPPAGAPPALWGGTGPPAPPRPMDPRIPLGELREGLAWYRGSLVASIVVAITAGVLVLADPAIAASVSLGSGGFAASSTGLAGNGGALAYSAVAALLGLVGLIFGLLAFFRWRGAVRALADADPFATPGTRGPSAVAADDAERGYQLTLYAMLAWLLLVLGAVVAIIVIITSHLGVTVAQNGTLESPTAAQEASAVHDALPAIVGLAVLSLALGLFFAYSVSRSLGGFLRIPVPGRPVSPAGPAGLLYLGVLASGVGELLTVLVGGVAAFVGVLGPALLLVANQRYLDLVQERLELV